MSCLLVCFPFSLFRGLKHVFTHLLTLMRDVRLGNFTLRLFFRVDSDVQVEKPQRLIKHVNKLRTLQNVMNALCFSYFYPTKNLSTYLKQSLQHPPRYLPSIPPNIPQNTPEMPPYNRLNAFKHNMFNQSSGFYSKPSCRPQNIRKTQ